MVGWPTFLMFHAEVSHSATSQLCVRAEPNAARQQNNKANVGFAFAPRGRNEHDH